MVLGWRTASSLESEEVWVARSFMPRGLVSQMGEHMPNATGHQGIQRLLCTHRLPCLIWGFQGYHTQRKDTEAKGLPKVAQAYL